MSCGCVSLLTNVIRPPCLTVTSLGEDPRRRDGDRHVRRSGRRRGRRGRRWRGRGRWCACYRAGAFRAAIVSTWIATVLDIVDKLRELDLDGDKKARRKIEEFEAGHSEGETTGNWRKSNEFERQILDVAKDDFELLAAAEYVELTRLRDDRNRCAHPSLLSGAEPYPAFRQSSPVYHLRNAVIYLLSHPPVQGQAAFDRIIQDIESSYFPKEPDDAQERLAAGPLAVWRPPTISSAILCLCSRKRSSSSAEPLMSERGDARRSRRFRTCTDRSPKTRCKNISPG